MGKQAGLVLAAKKLQTELDKRFSFITDPNAHRHNGTFESIYIVATALDPWYRKALNDDQEIEAKDSILNLV